MGNSTPSIPGRSVEIFHKAGVIASNIACRCLRVHVLSVSKNTSLFQDVKSEWLGKPSWLSKEPFFFRYSTYSLETKQCKFCGRRKAKRKALLNERHTNHQSVSLASGLNKIGPPSLTSVPRTNEGAAAKARANPAYQPSPTVCHV